MPAARLLGLLPARRSAVTLLVLSVVGLSGCGTGDATPDASARDTTQAQVEIVPNVDGRDLLGRDQPQLPDLPIADTLSAEQFANLTSSLKFLSTVTRKIRAVQPADCSGPTPVALQWADSARLWSDDFIFRVEQLSKSPVVQQESVRPIWQNLMLQTNNLSSQVSRMEQLLKLRPPAPDLLRGWAIETDAIIDRVLPEIIRVGPAFEIGITESEPPATNPMPPFSKK